MRALPSDPPQTPGDVPVSQPDVSLAHRLARLQAIAEEVRLLRQQHDHVQARCAALELRCEALLGLGRNFSVEREPGRSPAESVRLIRS